MSLKKTAEELLKIADEIEKEAEAVTKFVCEGCNHTATLSLINDRRDAAAKEAGENVHVARITVNDKVLCPACGDNMSYVASEESEAYYFDPEKAAAEEAPAQDDDEKDDEEDRAASEPIDYDSLMRYSSAE